MACIDDSISIVKLLYMSELEITHYLDITNIVMW